jgi:hypothetical protein
VSQSNGGVPPYRVAYSGLFRQQTSQLLARAVAKGRLPDVAKAVRVIHAGLQWVPLDFGQPLQDYTAMGLREYIGVASPLVVKYSVDEVRRIVYVTLPFDLLPNSGL